MQTNELKGRRWDREVLMVPVPVLRELPFPRSVLERTRRPLQGDGRGG